LPVCAASITDASFEAPAVGSSYRYNPAVSGVTFTAGAGVQGNGSAWGFANAPDGAQTAFLQSGGFASIAMAVTGLEVGQSYTVSFWESRRPNYGLNPYSVSFEGTQIYSGAPASAVWSRVTTASFIAAAMTGTLTFSSGPKNGDNDTGIDAVTLTAVSVPEPASTTLLGTGMLGLGVVRRLAMRRQVVPRQA
jgi:hypothetical protein